MFTASFAQNDNTGMVSDAPLNSLSVQRTLRGSSQARGQLSVVVQNHDSVPMHVLYLETMPWHVQFFLHTMKIYIDGLAVGTDISQHPVLSL